MIKQLLRSLGLVSKLQCPQILAAYLKKKSFRNGVMFSLRKIFTLTFEGWPRCVVTEGLVARQNLKYLHAAGALLKELIIQC